ncbi:MAG: hypothetical protein IPP27_12795 [Bacteroidetes bacterium]|nr:hypothetical protein [Bacteroidota bacterium]
MFLLMTLMELIKIITENNFNNTDKIIVSADTLFEKSAWTDRLKFDLAFDKLFDIEVKMIDDGKETDSFYMHD